jgi:hypothetical protein
MSVSVAAWVVTPHLILEGAAWLRFARLGAFLGLNRCVTGDSPRHAAAVTDPGDGFDRRVLRGTPHGRATDHGRAAGHAAAAAAAAAAATPEVGS